MCLCRRTADRRASQAACSSKLFRLSPIRSYPHLSAVTHSSVFVLTTTNRVRILAHRDVGVGVVNEGSGVLGTKFGFPSNYGFKWTLFASFSTVLCSYCLLVPNF